MDLYQGRENYFLPELCERGWSFVDGVWAEDDAGRLAGWEELPEDIGSTTKSGSCSGSSSVKAY